MFIEKLIRIGHGEYANGFLDNGRLFFYINTGKSIVKKEIVMSGENVRVVSVGGERLAMSEVLPISSDFVIGRYEKGIRLL